MATTTNYGWTTPDDTGLVKDGASAIRSLGTSIDTTTKNLNPSTTLGDLEYRSSTSNTNTRIPIGTSGQGLQVVAGVPAWAASSTSTLTTTGDLLYASAANTLARRAIGTTGQVLTVSGGVPTWATPTSTGYNWTWQQNLNSNVITRIAYNGTNLYVAVATAGGLWTSPDGKTWTSRTSGFGANNIVDVAFGNGLWVAVGQNGTITTSTDGTTWTARTSNMSTNQINCVVYANSLWVAVGDGGGTTNTGGITYSTDGITWTRKSQSVTIGANYYCAAWNGTNWIVGATISTNNYLYASTPSGTWTAGNDGSSGDLVWIYWDGTRNIVFDGSSSGQMRYSTSTTLGTTTAVLTSITNTNAQKQSALYNGQIYLVAGFLQSVIPATATRWGQSAATISPSSTSGLSATLSNRAAAIYVNATGIIIASDFGHIWTSF